jgi:hypothetical protein
MFGAEGRYRTGYTKLFRLVLYHLSYFGMDKTLVPRSGIEPPTRSSSGFRSTSELPRQ